MAGLRPHRRVTPPYRTWRDYPGSGAYTTIRRPVSRQAWPILSRPDARWCAWIGAVAIPIQTTDALTQPGIFANFFRSVASVVHG
jgi:hypothetical protein